MNNQGGHQAYQIAEGKIGMLICIGNSGDWIGAHLRSKANMVLIVDQTGDRTAHRVGYSKGDVGLLLVDNNRGDGCLVGIGDGKFAQSYSKGNVDIAIASNCEGDCLGLNIASHEGHVGKFILYNNLGENNRFAGNAADELITGDDAAREYSRIQQEYRTGEILGIAREMAQMGGSRQDEIVAGACRIKEIYETVKDLFEDGNR